MLAETVEEEMNFNADDKPMMLKKWFQQHNTIQHKIQLLAELQEEEANKDYIDVFLKLVELTDDFLVGSHDH